LQLVEISLPENTGESFDGKNPISIRALLKGLAIESKASAWNNTMEMNMIF
jgi:hypothetical protein